MLFRHAPDHYRSMLRAAQNDSELVTLERTGFGVSHDALGAALCESWGLELAAVASVRYHVGIRSTQQFPPQMSKRSVGALSAIAGALLEAPDTVDDVVAAIAPQAELDVTLAVRAARAVQAALAEALAHGRG